MKVNEIFPLAHRVILDNGGEIEPRGEYTTVAYGTLKRIRVELPPDAEVVFSSPPDRDYGGATAYRMPCGCILYVSHGNARNPSYIEVPSTGTKISEGVYGYVCKKHNRR